MKENYSISDYLSDMSEIFNHLVNFFAEEEIKKLKNGEKLTDDDLMIICCLLQQLNKN